MGSVLELRIGVHNATEIKLWLAVPLAWERERKRDREPESKSETESGMECVKGVASERVHSGSVMSVQGRVGRIEVQS